MYKIAAVAFLGGVMLLSFSCKKDKNEVFYGGSYSPPAASDKYEQVYGNFFSEKEVFYYSSFFSDTSYDALAFFYNAPQSYPAITANNTMFVNGVVFNNHQLYKDSTQGFYLYYDTTQNQKIQSFNWQVQGAGIIPSFNAAPPVAFPAYGDYVNLPDTVNIGQDLVLTLNNIAGADSVYIKLEDSNNHSYSTNNKNVSTPTFSITTANMSGITANNYGYLTVNLEKLKVFPYSGKNFAFFQTYAFRKWVYIDNQ